MKLFRYIILFIFCVFSLSLSAQEEETIRIIPQPYSNALRNPMKGFTTINVGTHPWGTLSHTYIRWNEIENHESDGIEKIINYCNQRWKDVEKSNIKVIPRIYLHWDGDEKYWPADMQTDDYTSEQFRERVLRLIKRLGICWDNDPRVAFIELGIFGKWGEHHSPDPTPEMQKLVGDAFAEAFKNKKVSVRRFWSEFTGHPFGEYWDSWAHYDQMYEHGTNIKKINESGRYKNNYIGGEAAYNWGNSDIQPGPNPTASVAEEQHRDFVINSIRWLHCTQLRWISNYDKTNSEAVQGAIEIQKAFGYRYVLNQVEFSLTDSLNLAFEVTNTGSAPFYYEWPVEVALLDQESLEPVWRSTFDSVDIRKWLPGEGWTDPEWTYVGSWQEYHPDVNWNPSKTSEWAIPPSANYVEGKFKLDVPDGNYVLALAILDPAGDLPAIKFATANYKNGGRHPMGLVSVGENKCYPLPGDFQFDDPYGDQSLYYDDEFVIDYVPDPRQTPYKGNAWRIPEDTINAWQYDYMFYEEGDKYFSLDSGKTIGIYGCDDTTGQNIRSYQDLVLSPDAAQYLWNAEAGTFERNGQWLEYSVNYKINQPYQLQLRARTGKNAHFKLKIYTILGDTIFSRDLNLEDDFENEGGGNEETDWLLSKFAIPDIMGPHIVRFDLYDNIAEPGILGSFAFTKSNFDVTPPGWYYIDIGTFTIGTDIQVAATEEGKVFLVPSGTPGDTASIYAAALNHREISAYALANMSTSDLSEGAYVLYAIDASGNVSEASREIILESDDTQVAISSIHPERGLSLSYNPENSIIEAKSKIGLRKIIIHDILGNLRVIADIKTSQYSHNLNNFKPGVYLIRAWDDSGAIETQKIVIQ